MTEVVRVAFDMDLYVVTYATMWDDHLVTTGRFDTVFESREEAERFLLDRVGGNLHEDAWSTYSIWRYAPVPVPFQGNE